VLPLDRTRIAPLDGVHTGEQIKSAIGARAITRELSRVPYLYRHLCPALPANEQGELLARELYATESRGISLGTLKPMGLRIVAIRGRGTYSRSSPDGTD
jgi:hypothetical protein